MADFLAFNATTHPIVKLEDDWNNLLAHGLLDWTNFKVRLNGAVYEAVNGDSGVISYGGADNAGATDGTDIDAVQQAAINGTTNGVVFLTDIALGTVTEKDGVWVIDETDGYLSYYVTNPTDELATQTNTQNAAMFNILSRPTNDPPTLDAWCAFVSEIIEPAAGTDYYCAAQLGAKALNGSSGNIWSLNTLAHLALGSTGNAIGIEVDVDNKQQDGVGEGIVVINGVNSDFDSWGAIRITADAELWQRGLTIQNTETYAIGIEDAPTDAIFMNLDAGWTGDIMDIDINSTAAFNILYTGAIQQRAAAAGNVLQYYEGADANEKLKIDYQSISFGAGGASALDCSINRFAATGLELDDTTLKASMSASGDTAYAAEVAADANWRWVVLATGSTKWGDGTNATDCELYRAAANQLRTPDQLVCDDGIVTFTKAGAITDADTTVDTVGLITLDTTNDVIYCRTGAAEWHSWNADAGFVIPEHERNCPLCGEEIKVGEQIAGVVEREHPSPPGSLHGLYTHLRCSLKEAQKEK